MRSNRVGDGGLRVRRGSNEPALRTGAVAIVALGFLAGCETLEGERALTIQEVVAPVPLTEFVSMLPKDWGLVDSDSTPLELSWCQKYFSGAKSSRRAVLVTCHEYESIGIGQLIRFYVQGDEGYIRVLETRFGRGRLELAEQFDANRWGFLFLRHNSGGSSSSWAHRVVSLGPLYVDADVVPDIREVPIERPTKRLEELLVGGRWPTSCCVSLAGAGSLRFDFYIHEPSDPANNFPTGGGVHGRFQLVSDAEGKPIRYEVASWEHVREVPR